MDGKGRWRDNVFVERLWKSVNYEHVYLHAYETTSEARTKLAVYLYFYNRRRIRGALPFATLARSTIGVVKARHISSRASTHVDDYCGVRVAVSIATITFC